MQNITIALKHSYNVRVFTISHSLPIGYWRMRNNADPQQRFRQRPFEVSHNTHSARTVLTSPHSHRGVSSYHTSPHTPSSDTASPHNRNRASPPGNVDRSCICHRETTPSAQTLRNPSEGARRLWWTRSGGKPESIWLRTWCCDDGGS